MTRSATPITPGASGTGRQPMHTGLGARGRTLAAIQALQVGTGLLGQLLLLSRWSPYAQTDLFLLLSGVPWLVSAAMLVTGLEMALPAVYHRALAVGGGTHARHLITQITGLSFLVSIAAALLSGIIVTGWAWRSGLATDLCLWMGLALGAQVVPATLSGLWRGALIAHDRLARARLTLLVGSIGTVVGYALLPGPPAFALPLTAASAVILAAIVAWHFHQNTSLPWDGKGKTDANTPPGKSVMQDTPIIIANTHPEMGSLIQTLIALGAAAGLVHLQTIIERAALMPLGTGMVTTLAVAGRGWEAILTITVAACVWPVYPRWAEHHVRREYRQMRAFLCWSLVRTMTVSILAAAVIGLLAWSIGPWLESDLNWESGAAAAQMVLVLLPRFVLVSTIQPLVLKHYASGTPWYPVLGSALGAGVLLIGSLTVIPRHGLAGMMIATATSVVPGWLLLGWREWRAPR